MSGPSETTSLQELKLQFQDLYESVEWKKLDTVDRAQLLLVAEGVKPGTIISADFTYFPKIAEKLGLEYTFNTDPLQLRPVYMVAKKENLDKYFRGMVNSPNKNLRDYWHHLNGEFLGYPVCCTDEYCHPKKNLDKRMQESPHTFLSNVDYETEQEITATGTYPEELDFCPPSFTPCSAKCQCASPLLKKWMQIIKLADTEAAEGLQTFHQRHAPFSKVHRQKLLEKHQALKDKVGRIILPY